ncbi:MAG: dihydropteroate synthase [Caldisericia bacterium]|nr:dihydropteroate synthase [Caldisericia bacterium]MDD4614007.1 dihydropteroate synthase [Caldisericia bacterium]
MLTLLKPHSISSVLQTIGCTQESIPIFAKKANMLCIQADHIGYREATILKQTFLSQGGDVAVHKNVLDHSVQDSSILMMGTENVFSLCLQSLERQNYFQIPTIRASLAHFLRTILSKQKNPQPVLMGILNLTPDSFSDGNECMSTAFALEKAASLVEQGADIIDIGGESTRPGARLIHEQEELQRVLDPLLHIRKRFPQCKLSLDTHKVSVAKAGIDNGIQMINCIKISHEMIELVSRFPSVELIVMHIKGTPETMQKETHYDSLLEDIHHFFESTLDLCSQYSIDKNRIILDPGIGFAKTAPQNVEIVRNISCFYDLGCRILVGHSRKSFLGEIANIPLPERDLPTAVMGALLWREGVDILRVHDVKATKNACKIVSIMHS